MSTDENAINQLYEELATLGSRISLLESNSTQRGGYFQSILEQVEKPKCCDPCGCSVEDECQGAISIIAIDINIGIIPGMFNQYIYICVEYEVGGVKQQSVYNKLYGELPDVVLQRQYNVTNFLKINYNNNFTFTVSHRALETIKVKNFKVIDFGYYDDQEMQQ